MCIVFFELNWKHCKIFENGLRYFGGNPQLLGPLVLGIENLTELKKEYQRTSSHMGCFWIRKNFRTPKKNQKLYWPLLSKIEA